MESYDHILFRSISSNVKDNQEFSYFKRHESYKLSHHNRVKTPRYINPTLVRFLPVTSQHGEASGVSAKPPKPTPTVETSNEESDCSDEEEEEEEPPEEEEGPKDEQQGSTSDDEELAADLRDDMEMEQETDEDC